MCGIAAIIGSRANVIEGKIASANGQGAAALIDRMAHRLDHRGPDATRSVRLQGCDLGHTRLSIIDLAGGGQPMSDEGERYWVVFNGEIFNYRELREELIGRGWSF